MSDDTILFESDLILDDTILAGLLNHPYPNLSVVAKYENWMDGTVVTIDNENNILSFIPKRDFDASHCQHYYKTVNLYRFSTDFAQNQYIPFLEAYSRARGNNEYYEMVLRVLVFLDQTVLKAHVIDPSQKWYEIDNIQDLHIAESLFQTA